MLLGRSVLTSSARLRASCIDGHAADLVIAIKDRRSLLWPSDLVYDSLARNRRIRQKLPRHLSVTFAGRATMRISVESWGRGDRVKAKTANSPGSLDGLSRLPRCREKVAPVSSWGWEALGGWSLMGYCPQPCNLSTPAPERLLLQRSGWNPALPAALFRWWNRLAHNGPRENMFPRPGKLVAMTDGELDLANLAMFGWWHVLRGSQRRIADRAGTGWEALPSAIARRYQSLRPDLETLTTWTTARTPSFPASPSAPPSAVASGGRARGNGSPSDPFARPRTFSRTCDRLQEDKGLTWYLSISREGPRRRTGPYQWDMARGRPTRWFRSRLGRLV